MYIYKHIYKSKEINVEDFPIQPVITHHKYLFFFQYQFPVPVSSWYTAEVQLNYEWNVLIEY